MKKVYAFWIGFLCLTVYAHATNYVWIGASGAKYSDPMSWSLTGAAGSGGAGVPGPGDAASFSIFATGRQLFLVNMDVSPTINNLSVGDLCDVTLVTAVNTTLTVTNQFTLTGSLLDSTSEDVRFNLIFDHATGSFTSGSGAGPWRFGGRVPVSNGNGAMFSAINGASVSIGKGSIVLFRQNAGQIVSSAATLRFVAGSNYTLENNLNGVIPAATWDPPFHYDTPDFDYVPAPTLQINGDVRTIRHMGTPNYGSISLNLNTLSDDASLALPDGTVISGTLTVTNTNGHTLTLLDAAGAASATVMIVGSTYRELGGYLTIGGATSKVALANAPATAPGTSYKIDCRDFNQTGGNFSLQDANNYTGSSTLTIRRDFNGTGGTFVTNSNSTTAPVQFVVELFGPQYFSRPSGPQFGGHGITISSGSIDNATHMVTLRMNDIPFTYFYTGNQVSPIGANLLSPLQVGRLELNSGPIFTTASSPLVINSPSFDAARILSTTNNSYISGPVSRMTNTTLPYMMPTGKGTKFVFALDTCAVIPASAIPSVYQAEYFNTRYADTAATGLFKGVDTSQYWDISKVSGADAEVRLFLTKAVPQARAVDNLVVAHYIGGQWVSEQGTVLSPGNTTTGSVTSKVLSSFSPFTFGYGAFINAPLAVHLISFEGHQENGGNLLNWKTASVASGFEVLRAGDGINFSSIGTIPALFLQQEYNFFDSKPLTGKNFYRLRSGENDGAASLSNVIMINGAGDITELLTLAPTVVTRNASLRINALKDGQMELIVTDMSGRSWKKLTLSVRAGSSSNTINLNDLPAGTYQISGYMNGKQSPAIRFIRQ